jgi:asparagine synthase (glutamine-hydrolysing)
MPYLFGVYGREPRGMNEHNLCRMMDCVSREPFYNSGKYVNEDMGLYIGWISHKDSFEDGMPVWNESGQIALFVSGEVFHDPGVEKDLKDKLHRFSDGDASYLVHLYEEHGEKFFEKLNGQYSGVIFDSRIKSGFLFNDRYGMKRIYVHEGKSGLWFSTTARALLKVLPEARDFDPVGIAEYLTCGATIGTRSLYKGISVLPSASLWTLANGEVAKKSLYFNRTDWEGQERLDQKRFDEEVIDSIPAVVRKYGESRQTVGISLTGGLDSRIVIACLDMEPRQYPCYTFGSMYRDTCDVRIARDLARVCRQNHEVLILGHDYLRQFPRYIEKAISLSDGYLGLSGAGELYVNALARDIAPVRMTGNYGSELIRGVRAFKAIMPQEPYLLTDFRPFLEEAQQAFKKLEKMDPVSYAMFHLAPNQGHGRLSIEQSRVLMRTPFLDNELVKLMYKRPQGYMNGIELSVSIIRRYNPDLIAVPTDRGDMGPVSLLSKYLIKSQRRLTSKGEYWMSHGMPQWVATLTRLAPWLSVERRMLGQHKFQHYRRWLHKELSDYVRDVLISGVHFPPCFDKQNLQKMVNDHSSGRRNYVDEIDKILTLTLAYRDFRKGVASQEASGN